jgi:hypothetical protein
MAILLAVMGVGCVQYWYRGGPWLGTSYVSDRPDLTVGCDAPNRSCDAWARGHAADFVPLAEARDVRIAILQYVMAPSPEMIIVRFSLSPARLRAYLKGKKALPDSVDTAVRACEQEGLPIREFPFSDLTWWPPPPASSPVRIYEADSPTGGRFRCCVEPSLNRVTVFANASRGR